MSLRPATADAAASGGGVSAASAGSKQAADRVLSLLAAGVKPRLLVPAVCGAYAGCVEGRADKDGLVPAARSVARLLAYVQEVRKHEVPADKLKRKHRAPALNIMMSGLAVCHAFCMQTTILHVCSPRPLSVRENDSVFIFTFGVMSFVKSTDIQIMSFFMSTHAHHVPTISSRHQLPFLFWFRS